MNEKLLALIRDYDKCFEADDFDGFTAIAEDISCLDKTLEEIRHIYKWRLHDWLDSDDELFYYEWHESHPKYGTSEHYHIEQMFFGDFYSDYDIEYLIKRVLKQDLDMHVSRETERLHIRCDDDELISGLVDKLNEIVKG